MQRSIYLLAVGFACLALASCSSRTTTGSVGENAYAAPQSLTICSGFGCEYSKDYTVSTRDAKVIAASMTVGVSGAKTAQAERERIAKTIALMERITRRNLRFKPDNAFSYQRDRRRYGQMDCVDESLNTTAYLQYLQKKGLLKFHKPIKRYAERGFLLDGRYPHKSARMVENSGQAWAVDSWLKSDGKKPAIIPLEKWYKLRNNSNHYT